MRSASSRRTAQITRAASTFYGGEATGRITSLNAFTDLGAMADFLQKLQQLEAPNPVAAALESDNPPARMIQASVLDDVTPRPHDTLVTERAVATVLGLRATPGQEAALMDGLAKAQDASEARGGEMRVGRLRWAGINTGMLLMVVAYESGAQLAAADAARLASSDRPLQALTESGAAQIVTTSLLTRIEL